MDDALSRRRRLPTITNMVAIVVAAFITLALTRAESLLLAPTPAAAGDAPTCVVVDGMVVDVAAGPFLDADTVLTLKSTYKAEFRWDIADKESFGWMRITDADGQELGWVPAGHEAIKCGEKR